MSLKHHVSLCSIYIQNSIEFLFFTSHSLWDAWAEEVAVTIENLYKSWVFSRDVVLEGLNKENACVSVRIRGNGATTATRRR